MDKHIIAMSLGNIVGNIVGRRNDHNNGLLQSSKDASEAERNKLLLAKLDVKKLPVILNGKFYKISDVTDKPNGGKIVKCVCLSCPKERTISATLGSNSNLLSHLMVSCCCWVMRSWYVARQQRVEVVGQFQLLYLGYCKLKLSVTMSWPW